MSMTKEEFRIQLRDNPTKAEKLLIKRLKESPLLNGQYEFQAIVGGYIVDFWFPKYNIAIELDGLGHVLPKTIKYDNQRTNHLSQRGYKVIRFKNEEIYKNTERVFSNITSIIFKHEKRGKVFYNTLSSSIKKTRNS